MKLVIGSLTQVDSTEVQLTCCQPLNRTRPARGKETAIWSVQGAGVAPSPVEPEISTFSTLRAIRANLGALVSGTGSGFRELIPAETESMLGPER
jgi:hypothetical protein